MLRFRALARQERSAGTEIPRFRFAAGKRARLLSRWLGGLTARVNRHHRRSEFVVGSQGGGGGGSAWLAHRKCHPRRRQKRRTGRQRQDARTIGPSRKKKKREYAFRFPFPFHSQHYTTIPNMLYPGERKREPHQVIHHPVPSTPKSQDAEGKVTIPAPKPSSSARASSAPQRRGTHPPAHRTAASRPRAGPSWRRWRTRSFARRTSAGARPRR